MQLPGALAAALDRILDGASQEGLRAASARLSTRYRAEMRDGSLHLNDETAGLAYLAARMPATFAALRAAMERVAETVPEFSPRSLLDCGAGPGTALWAAEDCWPGLARAELWEASAPIRSLGGRLAEAGTVSTVEWRAGDITRDLSPRVNADLVTLSYVLDELEPAARDRLIDRLWGATAGILLVVEPGTPAGWQRILAMRARLIGQGAEIVAPCPHREPCPIAAPDWCHFAQRVSRSRTHRLTKGAEVPWEDEKYIYLAAARLPTAAPQARIVGPVRAGSGKVALKLCREDGRLEERLVTRREGETFRQARRADWGDAL
ncbi:MAG: methyltransferase type 11 [Methylobacterium mesophilicum]|nr:methyltransferase type 11 [Methylobacterium mesophilicum]